MKIGAWFLGFLIPLLVHCSSLSRKKEPLPAPQSARKELERAQIEFAANDIKRAYGRLRSVADKNPGTDIADDAYMILGKIDFQRKDYSSAYQSFVAIVDSDVFSPNEGEALLWASRALQRLGRLDEALNLSNKGINIPGLNDSSKIEFQKLRFELLSDLGDRLDALRTVVFIAENDPDPAVRESFKVRAMSFVEGRMSASELESVADSKEFGLVRGYAQFRVGLDTFEQRDFNRARSYLSNAASSLPGSEISERAQEMISVIDSRRRVDPNTVGAVLPLTGKYSSVAQKTLRGLQLGLGLVGRSRSNLRLAVVDSAGNPDSARRGVERLVGEDQVIGIVGSLLSKTASAVAGKADELGVPSVALSQKSGITEIGESVFRNALTSEMQARRLARLAVNDLGLKKFAILYPNDSYGVEYANIFWDEVASRGGQVVAAQTYSGSEADFSGAIQRLVGLYYVEDRQDEYKAKLKVWYKDQKSMSARSKPPEDLLRPLIDFDAIFIPDTLSALKQIVPTLKYYEVRGPRILGTNLWNHSDLIQISKDLPPETILFVDSVLPDSKEFKKTTFFKEFSRVFGEAPGTFEAQGYDAGLLIRQALASGAQSRVDLSRALARIEEFPGALGTLLQEGPRELSRPAFSMSIADDRIELFAPARHH